MKERLHSLDILRGLDLFILVALQPVLMQWVQLFDDDNFLKSVIHTLFIHVEWEGFHLWDQVMPLFMFISGVAIPFSLHRQKEANKFPMSLWYKVLKRVCLLWITGGIVQGNFLELDFQQIYLYTDTLQAIACGYFFAVIIYIKCSFRTTFFIFIILPSIYTLGMILTGGYTPGDNLIETIDRNILGRFLYGAYTNDEGVVQFASWYHIGWLYSSINFVTTVISGVIAGRILRSDKKGLKKERVLLLLAIACLFLAATFSLYEPIIKRLWTSSMTFLSSGFSLILLSITYYVFDVKKKGQCLSWLKIYGMNSILAYMMFNTLDLSSLWHQWFHGLQPYIGTYYPLLIKFIFVLFIFLSLRFLYKKQIFLKV